MPKIFGGRRKETAENPWHAPSDSAGMNSSFPTCLLRWVRLAAPALVLVVAALPAEARTVKPVTGRTLDRATIVSTLPVVNLGDDSYAEVNSEWLKNFYRTYRAELSRMGVVKWDDRYDCRRFAGFYTELAQSQFFRQMFHSGVRAQTLALGPIWYRPEHGGGHAIIFALTEKGPIYLDPQSGQEVSLTPRERDSIFFAVL